MSRTRKKLVVGSSIAGLVLSLGLPLAVELAAPKTELHAGIGPGPRYSKPWKNGSGKAASLPRSTSTSGSGKNYSDVDYDETEDVESSTASTQTSRFGLPKKGALSRLFGRITGSDNRSPDSSEPLESLANDEVGENFFEPSEQKMANSSESLSSPPPLTAEVLIPPQPLPSYLPAMDFTQPVATQNTGNVANDPFPLPPLPGDFDPENLPGLAQVEVTPPSSVAGNPLIPPLPAQEQVAPAPQTPLASAETPAEVSVPEALAVEEATAQAAPEMLPEESAIPNSLPETALAEQDAAMPVDPVTSAGEVDSSAVLVTKKRGETATNLPLAPSSDDTRWLNRRALAQQPVNMNEGEERKSDGTANGWKNRRQRTAYQEPNTLSIPAEARPAELPTEATAQNDSPAEKYRRISERGERTGFKGFCPVALKDHLELVDATPEYRTEFEGQVYYFSSEVCRDLFESDPIRYVPAQGGIDLVKYLQEGKQEPGRLDFAVWYQDRLFLFSSENTLEEFRSEPGRFIQDPTQVPMSESDSE